jgi:hypothetical protein
LRVRVYRLWGVLPVPVIAVAKLPARWLGVSLGVCVVLKDSVFDDHATVIHELEHCKQFWAQGLLIHFLRYWLSNGYRLTCELEAFTAEIFSCEHVEQPARIQDAARSLTHCYGLDLDENWAISKLGAMVSEQHRAIA